MFLLKRHPIFLPTVTKWNMIWAMTWFRTILPMSLRPAATLPVVSAWTTTWQSPYYAWCLSRGSFISCGGDELAYSFRTETFCRRHPCRPHRPETDGKHRDQQSQ